MKQLTFEYVRYENLQLFCALFALALLIVRNRIKTDKTLS